MVSWVMGGEPVWAKDAREAGGARCRPRRRSRASADGRRGPEWRRGETAGRESPRPGEWRTGGPTVGSCRITNRLPALEIPWVSANPPLTVLDRRGAVQRHGPDL